jgi:hypothetical protein
MNMQRSRCSIRDPQRGARSIEALAYSARSVG